MKRNSRRFTFTKALILNFLTAPLQYTILYYRFIAPLLISIQTLQSVKNQMNELVCVYDDLQDRLYEIDRSWQNNLVFQGIKPDPGGVHERYHP